METQIKHAKELSKKQKNFEKELERKQSLEINKNLNDIILNGILIYFLLIEHLNLDHNYFLF